MLFTLIRIYASAQNISPEQNKINDIKRDKICEANSKLTALTEEIDYLTCDRKSLADKIEEIQLKLKNQQTNNAEDKESCDLRNSLLPKNDTVSQLEGIYFSLEKQYEQAVNEAKQLQSEIEKLILE